jgi:hypothetical protein
MVRGYDRNPGKSRRQGDFAVNGAANRLSRSASDSDEHCGKPSLTALLVHELFEVEIDGKTRAQTLVEALVTKATDGDIRAFQEVMVRIDGDAKSREAETRETTEYPQVDALTAQRILDVYDDYREPRPGH